MTKQECDKIKKEIERVHELLDAYETLKCDGQEMTQQQRDKYYKNRGKFSILHQLIH